MEPARRIGQAAELSRLQRFWTEGGVWACLLALVFYAAVLAMDCWPMHPVMYRQGQYISSDIFPRVKFIVLSETKLRKAHDRIVDQTPATFRLDGQPIKDIGQRLRELPGLLESATQPANRPETLKSLPLDDRSLQALHAAGRDPGKQQYETLVQKFLAELSHVGIVGPEDFKSEQQRGAGDVFILDSSGTTRRITRGELIGLPTALAVMEGLAQPFADFKAPGAEGASAGLPKVVSQMALLVLDDRPLYHLDAAVTEADINANLQKLDQQVRQMQNMDVLDSYGPEHPLIPGERQLNIHDVRLLEAEHAAWLAEQARLHPWRVWGMLAGRAGMLLILAAAFGLYILRNQRNLLHRPLQAASVTGLLILMLGINKVVWGAGWEEPLAVLTVMMAALVLTIAFGQRFALAAAAVLGLLAVLQIRGDLSQFLIVLSGAATAILLLLDIRRRSKLIEVALVSAVAVALASLACAGAAAVPWQFALPAAGWAGAAALLTGFLVLGLLPVIERLFAVATSMTLLECADASQPLLRRLALEAPGTYNHSLQLGSMCEASAEAIGARGLLARVGAYYHDIGKMYKPDYFIENQPSPASRHDKLSPAMSLLIITGHVKDGLELAREYGLPRVLHEFIASHHGTTLVQYFYQAASEQRKTDAVRAPDEVEFRYPGPKPRSKEAAILMLADASESSVRSMGEPTAGRIENQVHTMLTRRLMDGQLDDCELTLREVHQIETSLVKSLVAMYHLRVPYPTPPGQKPSAAELYAARGDEQQP